MIKDLDGDKYITVINNEENNSLGVRYRNMWKENKNSIKIKNCWYILFCI